MNTKILEFCKRYQEKLKNDKDINEVEVDFMSDFRERITFSITEHSHSPCTFRIGAYVGNTLFDLDEEDLKYLYDKYSKLVIKEMYSNIEQIKTDYSQFLGT